MQYSELKKILYNRFKVTSTLLPQNAFNIAKSFHLRLKNRAECKKDYGNKECPLNHANAVYALFNGEYVIYYDEKYPYANFAIAHEIAHHILGHISDGINQHHDAQLMAAIIVAPEELIRQCKIKSALQLAEQCKIPIDVAEEYWSELQIKEPFYHKRGVIISTILLAIVGILTISIMIIGYNYTNSTVENNISMNTKPPTITVVPVANTSNQDYVYVTPYGKKYHKSTCIYIQNKDNVTELSIEQAISLGYGACSICFQ